MANVNDLPKGSVSISGTATEDQILRRGTRWASRRSGPISYQWKRRRCQIRARRATVSPEPGPGRHDHHGGGELHRWLRPGGNHNSAATAAVANVNDVPDGSYRISGTATEDQSSWLEHAGRADGWADQLPVEAPTVPNRRTGDSVAEPGPGRHDHHGGGQLYRWLRARRKA